MTRKILELIALWNWSNEIIPANEEEIRAFEYSNDLIIPNDLHEYFSEFNGTNGYDENLFQFYSLREFKPIEERFEEWNIIGDSEKFLKDFVHHKSYFVFADYQIHLFAYVIKLSKRRTDKNEVYIFCGDDYKLLANSFTEFVDLCLNDSQKLFFND